MAATYPASKCHYTKLELSHLALCLGYSSNFFINHCNSTDGVYKSSDLKQLVESGTLKKKLANTFNRYDDVYNIKMIKKAMSLLRQRKMTFKDISTARVSFELHACENGSGMIAELGPVMEALKMIERVISPTRMEAEIQKQQHYCDYPTRIQMYEFLSLAVLCEKSSEVEKEIPDSHLDTSSNIDTDLALPDFSRLLMTTNQKILDHLEHTYRSSLYKTVKPTPAPVVSDRIISTAHRRDRVFTAREQFRSITPSLEHSQLQLHKARGGQSVFTNEEFRAAQRLHTSHSGERGQSSMSYKEPVRFCRTPRILTGDGGVRRSRKMKLPASSSFSQSLESISFSQQSEENEKQEGFGPLLHLHDRSHTANGQRGQQAFSHAVKTRRCKSVSEGERFLNPLVTQQDLARYEGKIQELEWVTLRRQTRQMQLQRKRETRSTANLKSPAGSRVQSSPHSRVHQRSKSETLLEPSQAQGHRKRQSVPVVMSFSELPIFKSIVHQHQCRTAA